MSSMTSPVFLFAPGAGAPSTSPWMDRWAEHLGQLGRVVRFDYPYALEGRKAPDRLPKLIEAHREALNRGTQRARGPVVLVGKSMGSRVGCHVALEVPNVSSIICLGYPLRGTRGAVRDEVLVAQRTPILFIQGSRDPLCPIEELEAVRSKMRAPTRLHVVAGGNHSLEVPARTAARTEGTSQDQIEKTIVAVIRDFLSVQRPAK